MSGFDFEALRDPDAPRPGSDERGRVDARARQLRARRLRNRVALSTTAIVAVAAVVLAVVALQRDNGPSITVAGPSSTTPASIADRFVPATSVYRGTATVPVTLPDGETTTMQYPEKLGVAQLGFSGSINVRWPVSKGLGACCGQVVSIAYTTVGRVLRTGQPVKVYLGAHGTGVPLLQVPQDPRGGPAINEQDLAFQFGPWLVRVSARSLTDQQRATFALSLTGTVDVNGYLVLHAAAPLSIGNQFDGGFGAIDDGNFVRLSSHSNNRDGQLTCGPGQSDSSAHRSYLSNTDTQAYSWCVGNDLHIQVGGVSSFVDLANRELQVGALRAPGSAPTVTAPATTTTTTTAPTTTTTIHKPTAPPPAAIAVSASFVSPEQGFVLEQSGQIDSTTDGGATWQRTGTLGFRATGEKIRFIGPSDGFAFGTNEAAPELLITHDAGAHWIRLDTPFSTVSDLAISNGTVYVVGEPATSSNGAFPGFRIWSSPVTHVVWTANPLVIPVGAGPVPQQQLVLHGDRGWMINSDRGIISGARLDPATGHWSTWTPPCLDVHGSAALAASTNTDLVAVCSPGFTTASTTTYIEFSHNGGTTFDRHTVPGGKFGAGGPLSPSSDIAVIGQNISLQRTTDGGATWQVVLHDPSIIQMHDTVGYAGMVDFGFTTTTQGFIVFDSGPMFMTHDAGATWQKVTLP